MRSASGALVGDGGGTGGRSGPAAWTATLTWNNVTAAVGAMANALPSARSTPGPAANAFGPAAQQLPQVPLRLASDGACWDGFATLGASCGGVAVP